MKRLLYFILLFPLSLQAGSLRNIVGSYNSDDTQSLNLNFMDVTNEFYDTVHKTSTETIRGFKYFFNDIKALNDSSISLGTPGTEFLNAYIDNIVGSTVTFTSATITNQTTTNLTVTTMTLTNLSTGTITIAGSTLTLVPVGTVLPYASTTTSPPGWRLCDGTSYSTTTFSVLFNVIGYVYGGSGANFNVPDMRGRTTIGTGQGSGLTNRINGVTLGEENHTLVTGEMPAHNHGGSTGAQNTSIWGNFAGTIDISIAGGSNHNAQGNHTHTIPNDGSGTAHNNMQPSLVLNFIIYAAK